MGKALFRLSYPAAVGLLSGAVYNIVDTLFIGLLNDTAAIGAATVVFPIFMMIASIGLGFGIGAASSISRLLGAKREEDANHVGSTAFFTAIAAALVFSVFGIVFLEPILIFFGATESILEAARVYGSIIIGGSIFQMLNMCMNNIIRSEGAAPYSARALIIGSALNILFDPFFMFVLDMGIRGAAVSTVLAQAVSFLYLLRFFRRRMGIVRLHLRFVRFNVWIYGELLKIGVPTFIRQSLVSLSMALINQAARPFGDEAIAGVGITIRLMSLVFMVSFGIGQGMQPLAGYNYGARQFERVYESFRLAAAAAAVYSTAVALLFFLGAEQILYAFSRDPAVIAVGSRAMRFSCITIWFMGYQTVASYFFQALGKGRETAFLAMSRQGIFLVPVILVLPGIMGLDGVFISQPIADFLTMIVTIVLLVLNTKNLKKEEAAYRQLKRSLD